MTGGATFFLRCAACHALYQPCETISLIDGAPLVHWTHPRPRRTPTHCSHLGAMERWDGAAWVDASVSRRTAKVRQP